MIFGGFLRTKVACVPFKNMLPSPTSLLVGVRVIKCRKVAGSILFEMGCEASQSDPYLWIGKLIFPSTSMESRAVSRKMFPLPASSLLDVRVIKCRKAAGSISFI